MDITKELRKLISDASDSAGGRRCFAAEAQISQSNITKYVSGRIQRINGITWKKLYSALEKYYSEEEIGHTIEMRIEEGSPSWKRIEKMLKEAALTSPNAHGSVNWTPEIIQDIQSMDYLFLELYQAWKKLSQSQRGEVYTFAAKLIEAVKK